MEIVRELERDGLPFILAEGLPPIASQPGGVQLTFVGGFLLVLGFIVGWWREGTAAVLIGAGWTGIRISESAFGIATPLELTLLVTALYGFCWWATHGKQTRAVVTAVVLLAAVLGLGRLFVLTSVFVCGVVRDAETGKPLPGAELRLLPCAARALEKGDRPNVRADADGRFTLYVGWYAEQHQEAISAAGFSTVTTNLGPRGFGRRDVKRDFSLPPDATAAEPGETLATLPPVVVQTSPVAARAAAQSNAAQGPRLHSAWGSLRSWCEHQPHGTGRGAADIGGVARPVSFRNHPVVGSARGWAE